MKRSHILDVLQVMAALLITSGMVAYAAPVPRPVTPIKASIHTVVSTKPKVDTPVTAPVVPVATPVAVVPTAPVVAAPVVAAPVAVAPVYSGSNEDLMAAAGIAPSDYAAVDYIVSHEGSWSGVQRYNTAGSGAYGLCQALPGSKMASAGDDWATNPVTQLRWCANYAASRYGSWWSAQSFWSSNRYW